MNHEEKIDFFANNGYLLMENIFSEEEVHLMKTEIDQVKESPGAIYEKDSTALRSLNGVHKDNPIFKEVCCYPGLLSFAKNILKSEVYVHQFKINIKAAFDGDVWEWHQDHIYWLKEDGMLKPDALTAAVFLTEANEFNAPITLIPKSHHLGTVDVSPIQNSEGWKSTVSAQIKYPAPKSIIQEQVSKHGLYAAKAGAGSILLFHSNTLHASTKNMSPYDRIVLMITYNSVDNKLQDKANARPDFLASRDFIPIQPIKNSSIFKNIKEI